MLLDMANRQMASGSKATRSVDRAQPVSGCDVCDSLDEQRREAAAAQQAAIVTARETEIRAHAQGHAR